MTMKRRSYTLLELQRQIRQTLEERFDDTYWVVAEISELKVNPRGHCYLELIEKTPGEGQTVARARANIWASVFRVLRPYFETTTGRPLTAGMKVMFNVEVTYHEVYGMSFNIRDIDPAYTLGEMALQRREIVERLRREGVLEMNRQLPFPLVPQRIAVISSVSAAGYEDFIDQLSNHPGHYHFHYELFPAIMQGEETSSTVIAALEAIYAREEEFDVVVIIRGGGSTVDLASFDDYDLALHITQFPLPVLTGIGHEKDETVADIVAYAALKTPTAVAEFLLDRMMDFESRLLLAARRVATLTREQISRHQHHLRNLAWLILDKARIPLLLHRELHTRMQHRLVGATRTLLVRKKQQLRHLAQHIGRDVLHYLSREQQHLLTHRLSLLNQSRRVMTDQCHRLHLLGETLRHLDPANILKRGYSITRHHGRPLTDASFAQPGDTLITYLHKGKLISQVKKPPDRS